MSRILIIEDEAAIRRVLTKILSEESDTYIVEDAEDGIQGLERIKAALFILLLSDSDNVLSKAIISLILPFSD